MSVPTELVHGVWLVNTLTSTAPIYWLSDNLRLSFSWYLRTTGKDFLKPLFLADVRGVGTRDEPPRASTCEANSLVRILFTCCKQSLAHSFVCRTLEELSVSSNALTNLIAASRASLKRASKAANLLRTGTKIFNLYPRCIWILTTILCTPIAFIHRPLLAFYCMNCSLRLVDILAFSVSVISRLSFLLGDGQLL